MSRIFIVLAAAAAIAIPIASASSTRVPYDRAFIDAMIPHHRMALQMARTAKSAGLSKPELVKIANAILATQSEEIRQMLRWRKTWYGSAALTANPGLVLGMTPAMMGMDHMVHELHSGNVNVRFARMMVDHHQGAVRMARQALIRATNPEIKALARRIIVNQQKEITVMQKYSS